MIAPTHIWYIDNLTTGAFTLSQVIFTLVITDGVDTIKRLLFEPLHIFVIDGNYDLKFIIDKSCTSPSIYYYHNNQ